MKKLSFFFAFLLIAVCSFAQPVVYFDFLSHNEDTPQWNQNSYYTLNRTKIIDLATYFQSGGITWNMQSEYVYLNNVLSQETPSLMAVTNNKNILRYLHEDLGVEMDPHSHEQVYIYPDVVKLMDSIGLPESKVIGGSIYNDSNGINIWTNLIYGQNGVIFPGKFWQPEYLMGGGTPNHVADLKYYGFWNPTDTANYLTNNPSSPLHHIGTGCDIKIKDTTSIASIMADIHDLINNVQNGNYPSNGIYLQTIFFEQGDLNTTAFYNKVLQVADSVNAIVATGAAQWKTFSQYYTIWQNNYNAQVFQWECGDISAGVEDENTVAEFNIYPNPANNVLNLQWKNENNESKTEIRVFDLCGKTIYENETDAASASLDVSSFAPGLYFVEIKNGTKSGRTKFLRN